jgi:AraC-like DNA-binding protein
LVFQVCFRVRHRIPAVGGRRIRGEVGGVAARRVRARLRFHSADLGKSQQDVDTPQPCRSLVRSERSGDRIQLYLARDAFREIAPLLDGTRGTAIDTPEGRLLSDYMLMLERNIPQLTAKDAPTLAGAIEAMLSACLAPSADRLSAARGHVDLTLMERVRRAVARNLRSPTLGPDRLCREAAMSRSQLYRLLEGEGGVAHYIQRRRLSESFSLLCDVSNNLSIGKVAEMLCFADGSSFSRAFRREFGMSPSDVRSRSLVTGPQTLAPKNVEVAGVHSFSEYLRRLSTEATGRPKVRQSDDPQERYSGGVHSVAAHRPTVLWDVRNNPGTRR